MTEEAICKWFEGDDWQYESGWSMVQPLIRCKDCKHYGDGYFAGCPVRNVKSPNDYCAWAERAKE